MGVEWGGMGWGEVERGGMGWGGVGWGGGRTGSVGLYRLGGVKLNKVRCVQDLSSEHPNVSTLT